MSKKRLKDYLEVKQEKFQYEKDKLEKPFSEIKYKNKDPLVFVRKFIMDKGLKLYGGLALHEHLKKHGLPIYKKSEFPDYDVYSPDAWNHAKELCDILYKNGFEFIEARSSILNDEHHQTFKVAVDTVFILDLTQIGCSRKKILNNDCGGCGTSYNQTQCVSIFNNMPCVDLLKYSKQKKNKVYTETYNYKNNKSLHPKKLFLLNDDWLKISMYRELTEPLSNPQRLLKVATRLEDFEEKFKYNHSKCKSLSNTNSNNNKNYNLYTDILNYIYGFIVDNKLINFGSLAHNFFIKNTSLKKLNINKYEVYTDNLDIAQNLIDLLKSEFKNYNFKIEEIYNYWKEIDVQSFNIYVSKKGSKSNSLIFTAIHNTECMPYVQYNHIRYVTIDRMKYIYYRAIALDSVINKLEKNPPNYKCLLSDLIKIENKYKKKNKLSKTGKYRRYVGKCVGHTEPKIKKNLKTRYLDKLDLTTKTKIDIDYPKEGYITKSYPMSLETLHMPYKPEEEKLKKRTFHRSKKSRKIT